MNLKIEEIKKFLTKDRRKTDRLLLPVKIFYSLPQTSEWIGPIVPEDISGGGIKLKSKKRIKEKTELNLKLNIAGEPNPIDLKGEVIYCKKTPDAYVMGVRLRKMKYTDRRRYVTYICEKILYQHLDNKGRIKEK